MGDAYFAHFIFLETAGIGRYFYRLLRSLLVFADFIFILASPALVSRTPAQSEDGLDGTDEKRKIGMGTRAAFGHSPHVPRTL